MDRSIEGSPRQESSSHEALPPRSVVPKGPLSTETGGKAQEALSQGKRRRAEETGEKQEEESTQAEPRDGKMLGKMQTLTDQQGSSLHCALAECAEEETGKNYANCAVKTATSQGMDDKQAKTPWEVRKGIVGDVTPLKPSKNPELLVATLDAVPRATAVKEGASRRKSG